MERKLKFSVYHNLSSYGTSQPCHDEQFIRGSSWTVFGCYLLETVDFNISDLFDLNVDLSDSLLDFFVSLFCLYFMF